MGTLKKTFIASPGRTLLISILALIAIGTGLLLLPCAQTVAHDFIDILFTAASATCVTGLLTIPIQEFTFFGQCIILALIQIGGLGFITLTVFLISMFVEVGFGTQLMTGQLLELDSWRNSKRIIAFIIGLTFIAELIGTCILYFTAPVAEQLDHQLFCAFFHAVSSFCSAGFTTCSNSVITLETSPTFLLTTALLILIGELGFITWHEIIKFVASLRNKRHFRVSLHTKLVLIMTGIIVISGSFLLWFFESGQTSTLHWFDKISLTLFNTLSWRSAGFTAIPVKLLNPITLVLIVILSFIGSSPGSTGSGIKTTTCAIIFGAIRAVATGSTTVNLKGRQIPTDQVLKSFAIFTLSLLWVMVTIFLLLYIEPDKSVPALIFEAFSAFTNLGLSLGITATLSVLGKIILIMSMIIGRIGSLTLVLAFKRKYGKSIEFHYPEERVMLG